MKIKNAEFVISNQNPGLCPKEDRAEFAFIGRSNVGKSSLINMLTDRKSLAKVSGTPGKTQLINHFDVDDTWYLVDLPGYGYARISRTERMKWKKMIFTYLEKRENLMCVFVLIDSRHTPQQNDLEFMQWLGEKEIPFVIVFTKIDKLNSTSLSKNMKAYKKKMLTYWEELPMMFNSSATSKAGKEAILKYIGEVIPIYKKKKF